MSEITREVLLGMGFEVISECEYGPILARRFESIAIQVELMGSTKFSFLGCWFPVNPHIRTLPQLRQFIRALFGDDALPRRELSSITDEEAIHLSTHEWPYQHGLCIRNVSRYDYGLFVTVGGDDDCISGTHLLEINWEDGSIDADRLVIKHIYADLLSMDFHLPAFHGDKGGEQ